MLIRRILFVMLMTVAPTLGVLSTEPAMADSVITASWNTQDAHVGDTMTIHVTFTNPETTDVTFTYLGWIESYQTITSGLVFSDVSSCTGEATDCNHYTVPIAPGATRTMTESFKIAPESQCHEGTRSSTSTSTATASPPPARSTSSRVRPS